MLRITLFLIGLGVMTTALGQGSITVLDRADSGITRIVAGNAVRLRLETSKAAGEQKITFKLADQTVGTCQLKAGASSCQTNLIPTLNWYSLPHQTLEAYSPIERVASLKPQIAPRPVVLVHGFISSAAIWAAYTAPKGFLAQAGLEGYAVGDGQVEGKLETGDVLNPTAPTHTIAENAAQLEAYIAGVRRLTGAEMVDLVAHSMGGLITRYYLDRLMKERDVAQLIMLGTPNGGSECANLPASLGFYLPAALELRPAYVRDIFNAQIKNRKGVPFVLLAGNPITERFKSPCTEVSSDLVVSRASALAIPLLANELPFLHNSLPASAEVFRDFVLPHLRTVGEADDNPEAPEPSEPVAFTQVFSGKVLRSPTTLDVNLDRLKLASFALFDPSRSLLVTVRGASGNLIKLSPETNGLIRVDDPASLVHLGYGFQNPKPGPWRITLAPSRKTPPGGAAFALSAKVVGEARLQAGVSQLLPKIGEAVKVSGALAIAGKPVRADLKAVVRGPDGKVETLALQDQSAQWYPKQAGLHGIDVTAVAQLEDGTRVERTAFLAAEVQANTPTGYRNLLLVASIILASLAVLVSRVLRRAGQAR